MFTEDIRKYIQSYRSDLDKLTAFTSALLKYYFLPFILGLHPNSINLKINKYGKPYISGYSEIDFNVSHSGEYVILGIAYNRIIGVDIEKIDMKIDLSICEAVFSPFELVQVKNAFDFYLLWVKKEAYLKCVGSGFATNLYQKTRLTTELIQINNKCEIYAGIFSRGYMLSVCMIK